MVTKLKIIAGLILIIVSFIYILRKPGVSMMESLMNHRQEQMEKMERQQAEEARLAEQAKKEAGEKAAAAELGNTETESDSESLGRTV